MDRITEAYTNWFKLFANQWEDHPATLDLEEISQIINMAKMNTEIEKDVPYWIAMVAWGAGYMTGYAEGLQDAKRE